MAVYAAARRRAGRPDRSLHCERGAFPTAHGRRGRGEARGGGGTTGRRVYANRRGTTLSVSCEAVMSRAGEIDRRRRQAVAATVGARRPGSGLLRLFPVVWGGKWGNEKIERWTRHQLQAAAISRNNTTTNRKQYQRWGGYSGQDSAAAERLGMTITRCFGRRFERRKVK
jgi:hypothetical protein